MEFSLVFLFETLHVIGLAIFAIVILPNLDVIQGIMLTNSVCLIPAILCEYQIIIILMLSPTSPYPLPDIDRSMKKKKPKSNQK